MYYLYRCFSISGWITAGVFFAYLLGFLQGVRIKRKSEPRGFEVVPNAPINEYPDNAPKL